MLGQVGRSRTLALPLAAALLFAAPAGAEIYKWTDENGNVVFSEKPPPGHEAETVTPRVNKLGTPGDNSTASAARRGSEVKSGYETKLSAAQEARKKQNCENARSELAELQSARANRLQYVTESGERAFITPEMLDERLSRAQEAAKKFCS